MVSVPQLMLLAYQHELYWWRQLLRTGGPQALIQEAKPPVRRSRHWHPDVIKDQAPEN